MVISGQTLVYRKGLQGTREQGNREAAYRKLGFVGGKGFVSNALHRALPLLCSPCP